MFSGIIEAQAPILSCRELEQALRIEIERPEAFDDLKLGDSVAVNGVCLTVEAQSPGVEARSPGTVTFALAAETLKVLRWPRPEWLERPLNLERSLRFGDRIHGHIVSGHVEEVARVVRAEKAGDSWLLDVAVSPAHSDLFWPKGSVTLQGVSLTINEIRPSPESQDLVISVCLIPETLKRTNLGLFQVGDLTSIEFDWMAKALVHSFKQQLKEMRSQ